MGIDTSLYRQCGQLPLISGNDGMPRENDKVVKKICGNRMVANRRLGESEGVDSHTYPLTKTFYGPVGK